jgi:signal transduction histidine kinase
LLQDDSGEPQFTQGLVFDVTAQKEVENLLRESEAAMERSLEVLQRTDDQRRRLMARVLSSEEEDRERMAVGIEDGSIQHMAAVGMRLETLKRALSDEQQLGALDQLGRSVDQALGRLKHLLAELRPRALETDGLAAALNLYLGEAGSDAGFEASLDDRLTSEPDLEVRTTAYRIAHEALRNVRLHAKARRVDVSLEERDGGVAARITDDGKGFDSETGAGGEGVGLVSMRERAELAGGWLRVRSKPGSGTSVEFWLPGGAEASRS